MHKKCKTGMLCMHSWQKQLPVNSIYISLHI